MNPVVIIFPAFALFVLVVWAVGTYNKFIKYRNRIEEAWSGINVALELATQREMPEVKFADKNNG